MNNLTDDQLINIRKHQNEPPVNVLAIAKDFGIKVYKANEAKDSLSGKIIKVSPPIGGESGYAIFVNANHKEERQRFTIAHEIAHFLLHKELIGDGILDDALYRSGLSNAEETAANRLAADILMPWHLINWALDDKTLTLLKLAEAFNVSESAMSIRLGVPGN